MKQHATRNSVGSRPSFTKTETNCKSQRIEHQYQLTHSIGVLAESGHPKRPITIHKHSKLQRGRDKEPSHRSLIQPVTATEQFKPNLANVESTITEAIPTSDDTHIHDQGQIVKKSLSPERFGSSPTPYSIMNKLTLAFFPTAAAKIRNLPPVHTEDLGQTMLKTADPVFPAMSPTVITRTSPGTFHDFPPSHVTPQDCSMSRMGGVFPSNVSSPPIHSRQRSVPQGRKIQSASQRMCSAFRCTKPIHPQNVLGFPSSQHATKPPVFLERKELLNL